jgi:hypothetical protein
MGSLRRITRDSVQDGKGRVEPRESAVNPARAIIQRSMRDN